MIQMKHLIWEWWCGVTGVVVRWNRVVGVGARGWHERIQDAVKWALDMPRPPGISLCTAAARIDIPAVTN